MRTLIKAARVILFQVLIVGLLALPATAKTFVYISCAEDGEIAALELNAESGELTMIGKARAGKVVMPMAVSPDRRHLYAAIRSTPYSFASYAIDPATGRLTHLATSPAPDNLAYISLDRTGRYLFGASYTNSKITVNAIGDGGAVQAEPTQVMNTGKYAHSILADPSNRFVYSANLGSDQIMQLTFDPKKGLLSPNNPAVVKTGEDSGPRHIAFSPDRKFAYVIHELDGMVRAFAIDGQTGLLKEIQAISSVPRDAKLATGKATTGIGSAQYTAEQDVPRVKTSDIHVTPDGKYLYASERTTSTLAAFAVDAATGKLRYINSFDSEKQPRGFNIDPSGRFLLAAGTKSGQCLVYRINRETGELQPHKRFPVGKDPNWIEIVEIP